MAAIRSVASGIKTFIKSASNMFKPKPTSTVLECSVVVQGDAGVQTCRGNLFVYGLHAKITLVSRRSSSGKVYYRFIDLLPGRLEARVGSAGATALAAKFMNGCSWLRDGQAICTLCTGLRNS